MSDGADIVLRQADALMRRHRSFVAQGAQPAAQPAAPASEEEIPLLTEVVDAAAPQPTLDDLLDTLHTELGHALDDWLVEALPAALANASQHILAELDAKARHSLLPQLLARLEAHRVSAADPSL